MRKFRLLWQAIFVFACICGLFSCNSDIWLSGNAKEYLKYKQDYLDCIKDPNTLTEFREILQTNIDSTGVSLLKTFMKAKQDEITEKYYPISQWYQKKSHWFKESGERKEAARLDNALGERTEKMLELEHSTKDYPVYDKIKKAERDFIQKAYAMIDKMKRPADIPCEKIEDETKSSEEETSSGE